MRLRTLQLWGILFETERKFTDVNDCTASDKRQFDFYIRHSFVYKIYKDIVFISLPRKAPVNATSCSLV